MALDEDFRTRLAEELRLGKEEDRRYLLRQGARGADASRLVAAGTYNVQATRCSGGMALCREEIPVFTVTADSLEDACRMAARILPDMRPALWHTGTVHDPATGTSLPLPSRR